MQIKPLRILGGMGITALLFALGCGGSSSSSTNTTQNANGAVQVMLSDDPTEDWATIGVKVLSVSLVPQGGGTPVVVYQPSTPPVINLVQLDQLSEIIGNAPVPVGTYTQAVLTLGANNTGSACDVSLVVSGDPEAGFPLSGGTTVPCGQIFITGAQGTAPNMTVPLTLNLVSPLAVTSTSTNALDLEFDLKNPAFIVEHLPASATSPYWAVNFNGPVRHHPRADLTKVLLRHIYGQVASVASDGSSLTIDRAYPVHPVATPETATVDTKTTLTILPDATNGTLFYNLDTAGAPIVPTTIYSFSSVAATLTSPSDEFVRIAARYQSDGTLVATRVFASANFNTVWKNPEGHVLHVNTTTERMWVTTEDGNATPVLIGSETNFYYQSGNTPIGSGTAFFNGTVTTGGLPNLARGFKVNVVLDPSTLTNAFPTAQSVEIDIARYGGTITSPGNTDFTYTRKFADADTTTRPSKDNYSGPLNYISSSSANTDQAGNAISGFYWWDFTFPTVPTEGSTAVSQFISATNGAVNYGGTVGALNAVGLSNATLNDPGASGTWAADWAVLLPTPTPIGVIGTAYSSNNNNFVYTVPTTGTPAAQPVTVDVSTTSGSSTLVYQVTLQNGVVTVTPSVATNLTAGAIVKVFGVPETNGNLKGYVVFYYTGTPSIQ
jgi:hypothetical protein